MVKIHTSIRKNRSYTVLAKIARTQYSQKTLGLEPRSGVICTAKIPAELAGTDLVDVKNHPDGWFR